MLHLQPFYDIPPARHAVFVLVPLAFVGQRDTFVAFAGVPEPQRLAAPQVLPRAVELLLSRTLFSGLPESEDRRRIGIARRPLAAAVRKPAVGCPARNSSAVLDNRSVHKAVVASTHNQAADTSVADKTVAIDTAAGMFVDHTVVVQLPAELRSILFFSN